MSEKLSVTIITYNEASNIKACLDAAWQVADEIVVVDSYSTDNTKDICIENGVRFFEHEFEGYIQQKDYATSLAKYDFVLSLDADEVLSTQLISSIRKVKDNPIHNVYKLNRLSHYVNKFIKHGHWFPDKNIRLFKKGTGEWAGKNPHDIYTVNKGEKVPLLKGVLYHYTYKSISEHVLQANRFSSIGAQQLYDQNIVYIFFKAILSPIWGFWYGYIGRFGFLDGWYGLVIAVISSTETFLKYVKAIVNIRSKNVPFFDIVQISSIREWRGGEQQVANLVLGLRRKGLKVYMLVEKNSSLYQFCKLNNIPCSTIKFRNGYNLFAALKVKLLCKRFNAKILHMHCSPSHTIGVFSNAFGNPAKLILSRRVIFPVKENFLSYKKFNYSAISKIICVSASVKDVMSKSIINKEKLEVVYSGIDIKKLKKVKNSHLKEELGIVGKRIVGNISAISREKDYYTFVDTAERVIKKCTNTHFIITGYGSEYDKIRHYISSRNLENDITMLGFRKDISNIFSILDVFLITSTMEGLGSTILDAFASHVPVVATRVGGIPEIVLHEKTGLLGEPKDADSLSDNVIRLLEDQTYAKELSENAFQLLTTTFSSNKMVNHTNEIYKNIMEVE